METLAIFGLVVLAVIAFGGITIRIGDIHIASNNNKKK